MSSTNTRVERAIALGLQTSYISRPDADYLPNTQSVKADSNYYSLRT